MIRPYQPAEDAAFVTDAWLTSFRRSAWAGMLTDEEYATCIGGLVRRLLAHPDVQVLLSTDDATGVLLGFAAHDAKRHVFHYVYVKAGYRDREDEPSTVAIDLLRSFERGGLGRGHFFNFTFRTQAWESFYRRHRLNCKHKHHLVKLYENQGS